MTDRPVIGITTSRRKSTLAWLCDWFAVRRAGGQPVRIMKGRETAASNLNGLVVGGGDDIGAELYQGEVAMDVRIDPERDRLERELLDQALGLEIPILGICRGAQMLNVHRGGTLHQDIYRAYDAKREVRTVLPRLDVTVAPGTRTHEILGRRAFRVNSLHHQAVDRLGAGLRVAATDDAGVVQAIEDPDHRFLIGVQWHPEFLVFSPPQQRLFRSLVAASRDGRSRRGA